MVPRPFLRLCYGAQLCRSPTCSPTEQDDEPEDIGATPALARVRPVKLSPCIIAPHWANQTEKGLSVALSKPRSRENS